MRRNMPWYEDDPADWWKRDRGRRPRKGYYEWYVKWALREMAPCDDCSDDYLSLYSEMLQAKRAGDWERGYNIYCRLAGRKGEI